MKAPPRFNHLLIRAYGATRSRVGEFETPGSAKAGGPLLEGSPCRIHQPVYERSAMTSDEASFVAGKGWGGEHDHLAAQDWSDDDYSDLEGDEILARELALDEEEDRKQALGET